MRGVPIILLWVFLLAGCDRNDLCYTHPHENLYVEVMWDLLSEQWQHTLPEGVRISLYAADAADAADANGQQGGTWNNYTYYRDTYGGRILANDGTYELLVFNSDTEMLQFRNMENIHTAEVYLENRTRKPYTTRSVSDRHVYYPEGSQANAATQGEELIGETDSFFAMHRSCEVVRTDNARQADTVYAHPANRVLMVTLKVKVKGLKGAGSCRASLSGIAKGVALDDGKCITETGTVIFDMDKQDETFLSRTIHIFGINKSPDGTPEEQQIQHIVQLEFMMKDNTVAKYECNVTDQIDFDAIEPEVVIPLLIEEIELPDVDPGGSGGGFDGSIDGWGDEITIVLH